MPILAHWQDHLTIISAAAMSRSFETADVHPPRVLKFKQQDSKPFADVPYHMPFCETAYDHTDL